MKNLVKRHFYIFIIALRSFIDRVVVIFILLKYMNAFITSNGSQSHPSNLFWEQSEELRFALIISLIIASTTYFSYHYFSKAFKELLAPKKPGVTAGNHALEQRFLLARDTFFWTAIISLTGLYFFDPIGFYVLVPFFPICILLFYSKIMIGIEGFHLHNVLLFFYFYIWTYFVFTTEHAVQIETLFVVVSCGRLFFVKFSDWYRLGKKLTEANSKP